MSKYATDFLWTSLTANRSGSVGMLQPNTFCTMLDDEGKEVSEGEPGELFIKGPQVCMKYWRNEEATKESLSPDGWLKTGDIAVMKKGWFWIVDRKKVICRNSIASFLPLTNLS